MVELMKEIDKYKPENESRNMYARNFGIGGQAYMHLLNGTRESMRVDTLRNVAEFFKDNSVMLNKIVHYATGIEGQFTPSE